MQKSFTKLYAPWSAMLLLLLWATSAGAQQLMVSSGNTSREAGSIPLQQMLANLETRYGISFNYAPAQVAGKFVAARTTRGKETDLEAQLRRTLLPLGLLAVKLSGHDYAIRSADAASATNTSTAEQIVKGKVTDEKGNPAPGVSIREKGTNNGTVTDAEGNFSLKVASANAILVFHYVGYQAKELAAGNGILQVQLSPEVRSLDDVVVTALGIKRQEKALGYSIATLKSDQVNTVKDVNVANALSGKVAGVNVRSTSSDPGATSLVVIRGQSKLDGYNQPLYVVDGVPIAPAVRAPKQPVGQVVVDYGSTISDINPDDIASMTVLKGASASALYGSRALNGVILITTKSGSGAKKGLGVAVNSSALFDRATLFPKFQNEFGAGDRTGSDETISEASWGPRLDVGTKHVQWDSPLDANGNPIPTDWVSYPNRHKDFFRTGSTLTNNIAVTGNNKDGNFRLSYTNLANEGITPNTDLKRNTINLSAGYTLHPKVRVSTNIGYTKNTSDNRPTYNRGSVSSIIYTTTPNVDIRKLRNYWIPGKEGLEQFSHVPGSTDNPYFVAYELTNGYNRDRIMGNVELNIDITKDLTLMARSGMDYYSEYRESKRAFSAVKNPNGGYGIETETFREQNTDFLLSYKKQVNKDFFVSVSGGANRMNQSGAGTTQKTESLVMPGVYSISNAKAGTVFNDSYHFTKRINSVYGMGQVAFRNYAFLDLTARNDWSSTLPPENNSYFYPSASLSLILTDMFNIKSSILSFAKVRANWAQVGGDTDPYSLYNTFGFGQDWGNVKRAIIDNALLNNKLKPLIATSHEFGADVRFLDGRLGIDVTYYNTINKNQILRIPVTMATGYSNLLTNAGKVGNKGIEIGLNATPVKGAFRWDLQVNYTKNRNKIIELMPGINNYLVGGAEGIRFLVAEGTEMGDMYAQNWATVPDGEFKGQPLLANDGSYQKVNDYVKIGNYNPDFMVGITNTFTYKGFTLNLLIDWRQGGKFFSYVAKNLLSDGRTQTTIHGRDPQTGGLAWNDGTYNRTDGMILFGYVEESPGKYKLNDIVTDPENYYGEYYWSFNSRSTFDASYVKLREASLTYNFSKKVLGRAPINNLSIAFIARNLFTWTAAEQGYDPETAMTIANGSFSPGVTSWGLPYTRSYGVKLGFNF
ncbi:SusC/RagA family TonB-linked outer membrane protein [Chitinophaga polysaccharea]|uniref:SusC/RagA family TonB-linked outer membrane protein n=1 Tax=Chitinophaga TaxID=79328 RepID=UPI001455BD3C|nr:MULTISPECIES: SusC/RagA family TonB-linked outer membrane protein [Chitinophaga]NLR57814.1 SusC/RagA family TonB-linked outer membrane protein [Chitinophaga polysaccharea]NLU93407.1 SusC/RagA family TonB-linked outer membrane protein [Chitinophaga sp. Ak27]